MTSPERPSGLARTLLLLVAVIVSAEALTYIVLAVLGAADLSDDRLGFGIGTAVFLAVYGLGQLWAAWRIVPGDAWARSPLVVTQIIQVLIAWNVFGESWWLAALLAVAAVLVLAALLAPTVTRALSRDQPV